MPPYLYIHHSRSHELIIDSKRWANNMGSESNHYVEFQLK